ncbi:peptidase inhibitor family I36 protein [Streptomyces sp. NPDC012751]|uniref:peptidase inhibitor family I36 protein n=1 Tax=Streptomyces sp. NPDC012751 TaxID=3364846 RepID=UPI0036ABD845
MSVLKKSLTTIAVTGALLGGTFATPAAAADPNTCPKGKFCGWSGTNRTGTRTVYSEAPGCYPLDHIARSVSNQTSYTLAFWKVTLGCGTGTKLVTLKPGTYANNPGSANGVEIFG